MAKGDEVLFYHSGGPTRTGSDSETTKAVVGIARVTRTAYKDPTAKDEDWSAVDLAPVRRLPRPVTLAEIKAKPSLRNIALVRQSRLSVMPLGESAFRLILKMGGL